jgi:hypothetical protein
MFVYFVQTYKEEGNEQLLYDVKKATALPVDFSDYIEAHCIHRDIFFSKWISDTKPI